MVQPIGSSTSGTGTIQTPPTPTQPTSSSTSGTGGADQADPNVYGIGVIQMPTVDSYDGAAPVSQAVASDVASNMAETTGEKPKLKKALAKGISSESMAESAEAAGATASDQSSAAGGGAAAAPTRTPGEIAGKYGVGGTQLTARMAEYTRRGEQIPAELQEAKRQELAAKGVDVNKIDAAQYLETNRDVANFWGTDRGLCDPQLAAAMHYEEFGKHEDRTGSGLEVGRAGSNKPVDGPTVDFKNMTDEQKYDYLQGRTVADAGGDPTAWKTGDREVNLVGVRSYTDGQLNDGRANEYNDTIYVCRTVDGKKEVHAFDGSVDGGVYGAAKGKGYTVGNGSGADFGIAHLANGFYRDAWEKGTVTGGVEGLRQSGWVKINADFNNNGLIDDNERLGAHGEGLIAGTRLQMQFHPGYGNTVGANSMGCQVIKASQYRDFQRLLDEAPASQKNFSYNLVDGRTLQAPDAGGKVDFQKATYDPINFYNEMNAAGVNDWNGLHFSAYNRGMTAGQTSGAAVYQTSGDFFLAAVSADGEGGGGIIQVPVWMQRLFGLRP